MVQASICSSVDVLSKPGDALVVKVGVGAKPQHAALVVVGVVRGKEPEVKQLLLHRTSVNDRGGVSRRRHAGGDVQRSWAAVHGSQDGREGEGGDSDGCRAHRSDNGARPCLSTHTRRHTTPIHLEMTDVTHNTRGTPKRHGTRTFGPEAGCGSHCWGTRDTQQPARPQQVTRSKSTHVGPFGQAGRGSHYDQSPRPGACVWVCSRCLPWLRW